MTWEGFPKVELHLHLEGAAPPAFIRAEAARRGVPPPPVFGADGGYRWQGFGGFLAAYEAACTVLSGPDAYARLAAAVLADRAADGVVHAEIFIAPQLIAGGDPVAFAEHWAAIRSVSCPGISIAWIAIAVRHLGPQGALETARLAAASAGLAGFGMAGDERFGHPADFAPAFDLAREAGLALTVHAGEFGGPDSVAAALDHLRPARIGHGVRAIESPALVARLAAEGIVLEVCPGSNIALGLYPDWAAHPVAALDRAGVRITLSTDDPPWFATRLSLEYAALARTHGWGPEDFRRFNRTAAAAAFCDAATRAGILARLEGA